MHIVWRYLSQKYSSCWSLCCLHFSILLMYLLSEGNMSHMEVFQIYLFYNYFSWVSDSSTGWVDDLCVWLLALWHTGVQLSDSCQIGLTTPYDSGIDWMVLMGQMVQNLCDMYVHVLVYVNHKQSRLCQITLQTTCVNLQALMVQVLLMRLFDFRVI